MNKPTDAACCSIAIDMLASPKLQFSKFIDWDILFLIPWFVFTYKLFSLGLGQHFLSTSTAENVTDFWRKGIFGNRLLSTLIQIFDEPLTRLWSCRRPKENTSMALWTIPALVRVYLWTFLPNLIRAPHQKKKTTTSAQKHQSCDECDYTIVNAGNRLLLNMISISIFLGVMTIVQILVKFALNLSAIDKHWPPINS